MSRSVLVAFLKSVVLLNIVQVVPSNDDRVPHLRRYHDSPENRVSITGSLDRGMLTS